MNAEMKFVSTNARIPFRCLRCGDCCRHVKDSLMTEPIDIYYLSKHLREMGETIDGPEDMLERYAHPTVIEPGYPAFLLNTEGADDGCVYLKDGRCSVYEARPQVCRMYPFGVAPGQRGKTFNYYLCTERKHHFGSGSVKVKDWVNDNFSREIRAYYQTEGELLPLIGRAAQSLGTQKFQRLAFKLLYFLYYGYNLGKPFLPQYQENARELTELIQKEMG